MWGREKSFPDGGEEFVYIIWNKMHCCLDVADIAVSLFCPWMKGAKEAGNIQVLDEIKEALKTVEEVEKVINVVKQIEEAKGQFFLDQGPLFERIAQFEHEES